MSSFDAPLARLYDTVFDRAPDPEGLAFWNNSMDHGFSLTALADHFMRAPEFAATHGQPTNRQFVESVYQNVLDRPGEAEGIAFWTAALDEGRAQRNETVFCFSESQEHVVQMAQPAPVAAPASAPAAPVTPGPAQPAPVEAAPAPASPLTFSGTYQDDFFAGSDARDIAFGFEGNDTLLGGGGDDVLVGHAGDDRLDGGAGDDTLNGGTGADVLIGGPGDDTFIIDFGSQGNAVADFEHGDRVLLQGVGALGRIGTGPGGVLAFDADTARMGLTTVTFQGLTAPDEGWVRDAFLFG